MAKRVHNEITPELVELFKAAMPAWEATWRHETPLSMEEFIKARDTILAFNHAAGVRPWEVSPLSPRADGPGTLRATLMALVKGTAEVKSWRRFARAWLKRRDEEMARWNRPAPDTGAR